MRPALDALPVKGARLGVKAASAETKQEAANTLDKGEATSGPLACFEASPCRTPLTVLDKTPNRKRERHGCCTALGVGILLHPTALPPPEGK